MRAEGTRGALAIPGSSTRGNSPLIFTPIRSSLIGKTVIQSEKIQSQVEEIEYLILVTDTAQMRITYHIHYNDGKIVKCVTLLCT